MMANGCVSGKERGRDDVDVATGDGDLGSQERSGRTLLLESSFGRKQPTAGLEDVIRKVHEEGDILRA